MNYLMERIGFWKLIAIERVTADMKVCLGPCFLFHITLVANAGGAATANIHDGHGTGEEQILTLGAVASTVDDRPFLPPKFFRRGLYVDVGSNVTEVVVHYFPIKE